MTPAPRPRADLFVFDAARAVAALAVLASHARSLVLLDVADEPALSLPARAFFALTSLGHQAVIVFFVVSGALVTRSLLTMRAGVWSPSDFAVARLCRLLVVLVPCLLLGAAEDHLGLAGAAESYGAPGTSAAAVAGRLGAATLIGNVAFLQGLVLPVFGSNVPLWTLAVEAWCYAGAFVVFAVMRAGREPAQAGCCLAAFGLAALFVLTPAFWALAPLWAIGAAAAPFLPGGPGRLPGSLADGWSASLRDGAVRTVALLALFGAMLAARGLSGTHQAPADYGLALTAAVVLVGLAPWAPRPGFTVCALRRVAGLSYSLYLSHFPILALCAGAALHGRRLPLCCDGLALVGATAGVALLQAATLWAVFERRTGAVRDAVLRRLRGSAFELRPRSLAP